MKLLPLRIVEDELGVSRWTLYQWIRTGRLAVIKVGAHYRVSTSEIERMRQAVTTQVQGVTNDGKKAETHC